MINRTPGSNTLRRSEEKSQLVMLLFVKILIFKKYFKMNTPFKHFCCPVLWFGFQPTSINRIRISVQTSLDFLNTAIMPKSVVGTIFSKFHPFEDKTDQQNKIL